MHSLALAGDVIGCIHVDQSENGGIEQKAVHIQREMGEQQQGGCAIRSASRASPPGESLIASSCSAGAAPTYLP